MPSEAYKHFRVNVIDVSRLIEAHNELSPNHRGRRALGHITRSGVVMLCACWELYVESVLIEAARYLGNNVNSVHSLPLDVRKNLSNLVKTASHELKPLELTGDGWKSVYDAYCCQEVKALNTPKSVKISDLFKKYIGISDVVTIWNTDATFIDSFVGLRGDIAHNGRFTTYVSIGTLEMYTKTIYENCKYMDNEICSYLHGLVGETVQPWRRATK